MCLCNVSFCYHRFHKIEKLYRSGTGIKVKGSFQDCHFKKHTCMSTFLLHSNSSARIDIWNSTAKHKMSPTSLWSPLSPVFLEYWTSVDFKAILRCRKACVYPGPLKSDYKWENKRRWTLLNSLPVSNCAHTPLSTQWDSNIQQKEQEEKPILGWSRSRKRCACSGWDKSFSYSDFGSMGRYPYSIKHTKPFGKCCLSFHK